MMRQKIEALPVHRTAQILYGNLEVVRYRTCHVAARFLKGRVVRAVWVQLEQPDRGDKPTEEIVGAAGREVHQDRDRAIRPCSLRVARGAAAQDRRRSESGEAHVPPCGTEFPIRHFLSSIRVFGLVGWNVWHETKPNGSLYRRVQALGWSRMSA